MKRLILLGGGHAHVFVLDALHRRPMSNVEVVLVAPYRRQVYSGMLPGWIAGHYPLDACMIPLDTLAARAGCRFLQTSGINVDAAKRQVICADGSELMYDVLSIEVGSTTALFGIAGAREHALPVRPIEVFITGWEQILELARERGEMSLAIVGGGAAGVELALSMHYRLHQEIGDKRLAVHLVSATKNLLPDHPKGVGRRLERVLKKRNVELYDGQKAVSITPEGVQLADGASISASRVILATGAAAPPWLRETGLSLDDGGFLVVDEYFRCLSHPEIFAAGDAASMAGQPRPKSGVYAVRAGPPLAENLRRALTGQALLPHFPQKRALYLMSTGDRHAVASWGPFSWEGDWIWRWKDHIDRGFVSRYRADGG